MQIHAPTRNSDTRSTQLFKEIKQPTWLLLRRASIACRSCCCCRQGWHCRNGMLGSIGTLGCRLPSFLHRR
jgi:hypothetical protein